MSDNIYDSAFEKANTDRAGIRAEIEKLMARGDKLDKLIDCLKEFVSEHATVASAAPDSHGHDHAHDHQEHNHS